MKRTKTILLVLVFALAFSALPFGLMTFVSAKNTVVLPEAYDIGPELRGKPLETNPEVFPEIEWDLSFPQTTAAAGPRTAGATVGQTMVILSQSFYDGHWFAEWYQCVATSEKTEIWLSLTNLNWSEGDSRLDTHPITHTPDMLNHLIEEFDTHIHPRVTDYFGDEDFLDGSEALFYDWGVVPDQYYYDGDGKNWILISNFLDENYYDPNFPSFIIGFYWSAFEAYYGRNIINLDAAYWQYLLGPEGSEWVPGIVVSEANEYAYESTTAHEYQHLLHDDHLPGDPSWMDEACSMFSEQVCEYPIDYSKISWFLSTPDNSLTEWGDQTGINSLADYGSSYLWALYLTDHFGWDFMGRYVQGLDEFGNPIPDLPLASIPRISGLLPGCKDFYSVYHDWRIANLIHSDTPGGGRYNYKSIDLADYHPIRVHEVPGECIPWTLGSSFPTITEPWSAFPDGYYLGDLELNPFSTDYIRFTEVDGLTLTCFNGDDDADYPMEWLKFYDPDELSPTHALDDSWWSGPHYALKNVLLAGEIEVPDVLNPTLNLLTYWDIEDDYWNTGSFAGWDWGFVQVSTDDGETWVSLANEYTSTDPVKNCHNKMKDYLPGLTGWTWYYTGEWYVPIPMSFDLSAFAGQDVLLGFRFMTDWGTEYDGWFIVEADVEGVSIMDDLAPAPHEADFMVTAVEIKELPSGKTYYKVQDMWFKCDALEIGAMLNQINKWENLILIISATHEYGTVDYKFKAKSYHWNRWKKDCTKF